MLSLIVRVSIPKRNFYQSQLGVMNSVLLVSDFTMTEINPQSVQNAIAACDNSHTQIHRAIDNLKRGSQLEAKRLMSQAIAALANALAVL